MGPLPRPVPSACTSWSAVCTADRPLRATSAEGRPRRAWVAQGCGVQSEECGHPKKSSWIERPGVRLQADRSQAGPAWLRPCYRPLCQPPQRGCGGREQRWVAGRAVSLPSYRSAQLGEIQPGRTGLALESSRTQPTLPAPEATPAVSSAHTCAQVFQAVQSAPAPSPGPAPEARPGRAIPGLASRRAARNAVDAEERTGARPVRRSGARRRSLVPCIPHSQRRQMLLGLWD